MRDAWFCCDRCGRGCDPSGLVICPVCWSGDMFCREPDRPRRRAEYHLERDRLAAAFFIPAELMRCGCYSAAELAGIRKRRRGLLGSFLANVRRDRPKTWGKRCARAALGFRRYENGGRLASQLAERIRDWNGVESARAFRLIRHYSI